MERLEIRSLSGADVTVSMDDVDAFAGTLRGRVVLPSSSDYDEARAVWNAMIDRRPAVIVECAGAADVKRAVDFARERNLLVSVRGGGHNIAGNAVVDGGMMISLRRMTSVRVDPAARTARVEPGATLGDLDRESQTWGLATPVGINSTTGIAGLTLGGGFGWLSRKHGATIDNLVSVDVVTADGRMLRASAGENPDLFWGLRGGGGNFGIATSFELRLHPVGPTVLAGLVVHPLEDAREILRAYREFTAKAPDELSVWVVLRQAPPLPFLPDGVHGTPVVVLAAVYAGDPAAGEASLAPLRSFGSPIADVIGPTPYVDFQAAFDPLLTPGARNYWKSHDFLELGDELVETVLGGVERLPGFGFEIFIAHLGGAVGRVPEEATAYRDRRAEFVMNVHGRWDDPAEDEAGVAWCRKLFDALGRFATGGGYVNFMTGEEGDRVESAYGANYPRLVALKERYDPTNFFRMNQNIRPRMRGVAAD